MLKRFLQNGEGQDFVELILLIVLLGAAAFFVLTATGRNVGELLARLHPRSLAAPTSLPR